MFDASVLAPYSSCKACAHIQNWMREQAIQFLIYPFMLDTNFT
jgi:hypothetical protein